VVQLVPDPSDQTVQQSASQTGRLADKSAMGGSTTPQAGSTGFGPLDHTVQQSASQTGRQAARTTRGGSTDST
jgi:hypothetical protein